MSFAFEGVVRQAAVSSDIPLDDCNWGKSSDGVLRALLQGISLRWHAMEARNTETYAGDRTHPRSPHLTFADSDEP